ncbi:RICIN domain-containing protein [Streptomyces sp. NPDC005483]|uniref:RICIN domain-containing protein n=1 Tax=Streptomyces sp. NPDC005483 TaxID=3154882 RepID=UPI0033BD98DF
MLGNGFNGSHVLTNIAGGRVLDEPGGQPSNGTQMEIWNSNGRADQHWSLR